MPYMALLEIVQQSVRIAFAKLTSSEIKEIEKIEFPQAIETKPSRLVRFVTVRYGSKWYGIPLKPTAVPLETDRGRKEGVRGERAVR